MVSSIQALIFPTFLEQQGQVYAGDVRTIFTFGPSPSCSLQDVESGKGEPECEWLVPVHTGSIRASELNRNRGLGRFSRLT